MERGGSTVRLWGNIVKIRLRVERRRKINFRKSKKERRKIKQ
jgi:hypothetical protein